MCLVDNDYVATYVDPQGLPGLLLYERRIRHKNDVRDTFHLPRRIIGTPGGHARCSCCHHVFDVHRLCDDQLCQMTDRGLEFTFANINEFPAGVIHTRPTCRPGHVGVHAQLLPGSQGGHREFGMMRDSFHFLQELAQL